MVPYLGTYLTVLTMLDTALTDTVEVNTLTHSQHLNTVVSAFQSAATNASLFCREA